MPWSGRRCRQRPVVPPSMGRARPVIRSPHPRATQDQSRRRSRGRMTAPTIHMTATHAKHMICSPRSRNLQAGRHENNRRSEIVRAKDDVLVRHATRPLGACCGPPDCDQCPGGRSCHGFTANCTSQAASCWTVENNVLTIGSPSSAPGFHWHAHVYGRVLEEEFDHYLVPVALAIGEL